MKINLLSLSAKPSWLALLWVSLAVTACQTKDEAQVVGPPPDESLTLPRRSGAADADLGSSGSALAAIAPGRARVTTTVSGLQFQVLRSGPADGRPPIMGDRVSVHYRGTLTNGTVFDSSYDRGEPATFGVGEVIPGWTEALQMMRPGDKWLLYIPSNLAYGPRAMGDKIPANSDLIFQVELLKVL